MLGHADVSLLLNMHIRKISTCVLSHERETGEVVPRRGTVHDMGRSVSHKAIICYKRLVEQKPTSQVAQETFHSPEDVEHYVQCFRRIQLCRDKGLSPEEVAQATGHSLSLVQEYLDLIKKFGIPPLADPEKRKGDSRSAPETTRERRLAGVPGATVNPPVAGWEPAKACEDASPTKR